MIHTIGHSKHPIEHFVHLLRQHGITAVADVRSMPRHLVKEEIPVAHILDSGALEEHSQALARLRGRLKMPEHDMFRSEAQLNEEAYELQGRRIAYADESVTADRGK